jgi:hypothetical protein
MSFSFIVTPDEGFDDRQQGERRERRSFVGLCPNDFEI